MEKQIKDAITSILKKENIKLVDVRLGYEDNVKTLFIVIDSKDGVDTDLCEEVIKMIDPIIDSLNLDLENYVLDVCSKGEQE